MPKGVRTIESGPPSHKMVATLYGKQTKIGRDAIIKLARSYSQPALRRLHDLMNGKGGKIKVLVPGTSTVVEVDVEVPAASQVRAAEILLNRAWGMAPQALLIGDTDGESAGFGPMMMSIMDRINAIREAHATAGRTVDLEASAQTEVLELETSAAGPASDDPMDLV